VVHERESPSVLSLGIVWASRITTLALEFSVPVVAGVGLDRWWRTGPFLTITGAVLGFVLFMFHTLQMTRELKSETDRAVGRSRKQKKSTGKRGPA
jgi:ATP synthase protein I